MDGRRQDADQKSEGKKSGEEFHGGHDAIDGVKVQIGSGDLVI